MPAAGPAGHDGLLPATAVPQGTGDYCYIREVHPGFLENSYIHHLTDNELDDFPQYGKFIRVPGNFSKTWINGHRAVGDFIDYQHRFSGFLNLSCRNSSYDECRTRQVPVVFEYDGRYHEAACLPGFGGAHRTRDQ